MKVLIVGAGIGGMTLAAFLEGSNVDVEIIEKAPNWSHRGFLLSVWDNGRDILRKLGLAERLDREGQVVRQYVIKDGKGRILRAEHMSRFYLSYGGATIIPRGSVHDWLREKVGPSRIRMNLTLRSLVQQERTVMVAFSDGTSSAYDLVVGADGINSSVRTLVFGNVGKIYENWRVWCAWIDNRLNDQATVSEYVEAGEFAIVVSGAGKTSLWLFAPADHTKWDDENGRVTRLKELFKDESALIPHGIENLTDKDVLPSDLLTIELPRWRKGRVVLLGDAAHAFGPHAGIGGSMALEDGYVLAAELMKVSEDSVPLGIALEAYERKRRKRVDRALHLSRRVRRGTLIRSPFLRTLVNIFMPFVPERYLSRDLDLLLKEEI